MCWYQYSLGGEYWSWVWKSLHEALEVLSGLNYYGEALVGTGLPSLVPPLSRILLIKEVGPLVSPG